MLGLPAPAERRQPGRMNLLLGQPVMLTIPDDAHPAGAALIYGTLSEARNGLALVRFTGGVRIAVPASLVVAW